MSTKPTNKLSTPKLSAAFWPALQYCSSLGLRGAKDIALVIFLFGLSSLTVLAYSIYYTFTHDFQWINALCILISIAFNAVATLAALILTYRYIFRKTVERIYNSTNELRLNLCTAIVNTFRTTLSSDQSLETGTLENTEAAWNNGVANTYQKIPNFFKTGINQVFSQIPVVSYLVENKQDVLTNSTLASEKLYKQTDQLARNYIIGTPSNNLTWIFWAITIIISWLIVHFLIV